MKQQILTAAALILVASMSVAGCQIMPEQKSPSGPVVPVDSVDPDGPAISEPAAQPGEDTASCAPGVLTRLVGQPESALDVVDLNENTRVLHPGTAATTDHRPDRINIDIDARGIISRVWCG